MNQGWEWVLGWFGPIILSLKNLRMMEIYHPKIVGWFGHSGYHPNWIEGKQTLKNNVSFFFFFKGFWPGWCWDDWILAQACQLGVIFDGMIVGWWAPWWDDAACFVLAWPTIGQQKPAQGAGTWDDSGMMGSVAPRTSQPEGEFPPFLIHHPKSWGWSS